MCSPHSSFSEHSFPHIKTLFVVPDDVQLPRSPKSLTNSLLDILDSKAYIPRYPWIFGFLPIPSQRARRYKRECPAHMNVNTFEKVVCRASLVLGLSGKGHPTVNLIPSWQSEHQGRKTLGSSWAVFAYPSQHTLPTILPLSFVEGGRVRKRYWPFRVPPTASAF